MSTADYGDSERTGPNLSRRRMLIGTTGALATVAMLPLLGAFKRSWDPSAKARAAGAPVTQDVGGVESGQMITVEWQSKPIYVVNRTKEMMDNLPKNDSHLLDPGSEASDQPEFAKNPTRSINNSNILVLAGICTHLGCAPMFRPEVGAADLGSDWLGGFYCPCHGSKYDLAGRVYKGVPAPLNLPIPAYTLDGTVLTVGGN